MAVLFKAGDQVPEIPLLEVMGKGLSAVPAQTAVTGLKVGMVLGFTVMVRLAVVAHWPAFGVKV